MSTDTLEDIEILTTLKIDTSNGDHDRFAHYVKQEDIIRSTFDGTPAVALCGKVWVANRSPEGLTVCPTCREIYENPDNFKPEDDE